MKVVKHLTVPAKLKFSLYIATYCIFYLLALDFLRKTLRGLLLKIKIRCLSLEIIQLKEDKVPFCLYSIDRQCET